MRQKRYVPLVLIVLAHLPTAARADAWEVLPPLPDPHGFAGMFGGSSHGMLLVAGGANFPDETPWRGGTKVWYDTIYALERPHGEWKIVGKLPRPQGYGVSVTHREGVVCVGGSDADQHYADVLRLEWNNGRLTVTDLPSLPHRLANACGAMVGDTLYVAGGQESPEARTTSNAVYRIDLSAELPTWARLEPCPGSGRMLAVASGFGGAFWCLSGVDLVAEGKEKVARKYLTDAYRYEPRSGWKRIADLPRPVVGAPSAAPYDAAGFYVIGGDDGSQVDSAPERHRGFTATVLRYDPEFDRWMASGTVLQPRVTVPCVRWGNTWVLPSGEVRPGVRSPEVLTFPIPAKE